MFKSSGAGPITGGTGRKEQPGDENPTHTMEVYQCPFRFSPTSRRCRLEQNLLNSSNAVAKAEQDLSSGLRINSASDDAAGYAISQGLTSQINGLSEAANNTNDAVSMVQTASSALTNVQSMLQRVYELGVQYNNGTNSSTDKSDIQAEVNQLTQEINRQQTSSNFNGINLLDGSAGASGTVTFQVGANAGDSLGVTFSNVETSTMNGATGFTWTSASSGGTVFDLSSSTALSNLTLRDQRDLELRG